MYTQPDFLLGLIGQTEPPLSGPMGDLCDMALDGLENLSNEVHIEEYSYLDAFYRGTYLGDFTPDGRNTD